MVHSSQCCVSLKQASIAEWHGISVNKSLMSGPDPTNQKIEVLAKFREKPVAVIADIKLMLCQLFVAVTPIASCSNYALQKSGADNETKYGTEVAENLRNNFYVDDMLKSVSNEETAIKLIQGVRKIRAGGNFHLTKFVSNNKCCDSEQRNGVLDQDLNFGMLPTEKTLGIYWNTEEDSIGFKVRLKEKPNTERSMLPVHSVQWSALYMIHLAWCLSLSWKEGK